MPVPKENIGLGVYARMALLNGASVHEITSEVGTRMTGDAAQEYISAVEKPPKSPRSDDGSDDDDNEETGNGKTETFPRFNALLGTIAFVNHACAKCCNCVTCEDEYEDETGESNWTFLKARKDIKKGEELTVFYSFGCDHPCRVCGIVGAEEYDSEEYDY